MSEKPSLKFFVIMSTTMVATITWTVGEDADDCSNEDDDAKSLALYEKVDDWLLANDIKENETVMICYWW